MREIINGGEMNEYIELKIENWREWLPKYHGKEIEFSNNEESWQKDILTGIDTSSCRQFNTKHDRFKYARVENLDYIKHRYTHSDIINGWMRIGLDWYKITKYYPVIKRYSVTFRDTCFTLDELQKMDIRPEPPDCNK